MPPLSPLAEFFAGNPGAAATIRATHVDDGGGKCARCVVADSRGRHDWPCTLRTAADRGLAAHRDSAPGPTGM